MDSVAVRDIVRLPHGEIVKVEIVYDDGDARVKRIAGDRAGTIAVCKVSMLDPFSEDREAYCCVTFGSVI
jgi:hypothetical protein